MQAATDAGGRLRIAIIGAGPAGLALASTLALGSEGLHKTVIYEAAPVLREVGVALSIIGRSFAISRALGIEPQLNTIHEATGGRVENEWTAQYRRSDLTTGHDYYMISLGKGQSFHRAHFQGALVEHISQYPQVEVQLSKRLTGVITVTSTEYPSYELTFEDGSSAVADVVIGCDGVKSTTRAEMLCLAAYQLKKSELMDLKPAAWSGEWIYRSTFSIEKLDAAWATITGSEDKHRVHHKTALLYSGKGYHIVAYLIANRTLVNVGVFESEFDREGEILPERDQVQNDVDTARLADIFFDWEMEAQVLIRCLEKTSRWAINVTQKLPFFSHAGIAIVGDAAHAMTVHLASGANQAIEDAYVLGRVLSAPKITRATAHFALQAYSTTRMPRAQAIAEASRDVGRLVEWVFVPPGEKDPITDEAASCLELDRLSKLVPAGDSEDEVKLALKEFDRLVQMYRVICYDI